MALALAIGCSGPVAQERAIVERPEDTGQAALVAKFGKEPLLTLDSVLARVTSRNPELKMWEAKVQSREALAKGAKALMPPEIGVGGLDLPYGMAMEKADTMGGAVESPPGEQALMISVQQMFPGWGKREARSRWLGSLAGQDKAGGRWMKVQLLADAKRQYYLAATADRKLSVLSEAEAVMDYMLKVAETRFKFRRADLATVQEAKARLKELATMRIMEISTRRQALSALQLLMADTSQSGFSVDTSLGLNGYASRTLESTRVQGRYDLDQTDESIKAMELNREWMARQNRPDFGLRFEHMEMFDMGERRYSVMGMMTLPFMPWSSGMARSETVGMAKDIESMREESKAKRLMALKMARETLIMLQAEVEQSDRFKLEVVPAYRNALDASMAAYQEGSGDLFRVLDIWDRWIMGRMTALEHFGKALALEADYERDSGTR
ncbi:MAG: TolC family protein [Fibrobacteria bacterium]